MAFEPRVFDTILLDMIAHVQANTTLTDFTVGSVIRTILEAAALEDDEQYHQMVQLLDGYRLTKASGSDLDERVADYNITRLIAAPAITYVVIQNDSLVKDVLTYDISITDTSATLDDSSEFPTSGYPYTVRIGEGTAFVEDVSVSNNNTTTNVLTITSPTYAHSSGERVSEVPTLPSETTIASGTQVQVPATGTASPIVFETVEKGTQVDGNYQSTRIMAKALVDGSAGNVGSGKITQFTGSAPYTGASVTNVTNAAGGRDRETDVELRARAKAQLNALSKGTIRAIESTVKGTEDSATGQRVVSANLVEDFNTEEHLLYIDDGTGFTPTKVNMARTTASAILTAPTGNILVNSTSEFPSSGYILLSPDDPSLAELQAYTSKTTTQLTLSGTTSNTHPSGALVILVDVLPLAEEGQNYFRFSNWPILANSYEVYDDSLGAYNLRTEGTDYFLNRTNAELQYEGSGLPAGAQVLGHYNYYTGLAALAQKVVTGDRLVPVNYPGVASAGIPIYVTTPIIRQVPITLSIAVDSGEDEEELKSQAQSVVETYIGGLLIGQNVILAEIIERVMGITGVTNCILIDPTGDIVILENELPRPYDNLGASLITVL